MWAGAAEAIPSGRDGHPGKGEPMPLHTHTPRDASGSFQILLDFPMSAIPSSIPGKDGRGEAEQRKYKQSRAATLGNRSMRAPSVCCYK